ncbi:MAG: DM13 domain-containing protein [Candidatus Liptonbacteria bacterium]|nr:DM13 domain-containing protein [Candidatus Liptonbacteria bacterium]
MRIKLLVFFAAIILAGTAYWLITPLFVTREVNEAREEIFTYSRATPPEAAPELLSLAQGTFSGLAGHRAEGTATLIQSGGKYFIRFEENFYVTNGPDVFVHLGKNGKYAPEAQLGPLKGNLGGQNYEIPSHIDPALYNEVWVWCRAFSVPFGKALLTTSTTERG